MGLPMRKTSMWIPDQILTVPLCIRCGVTIESFDILTLEII